LLAACVGLAVVASFGPVHDRLATALGSAGAAIAEHRALGALLFIVLAAASAMLAFFSSAVLVPPALSVWGEWQCVAMLWIGWVIGGMTSYGIAAWLGRPVVERLVSPRLLSRYQSLADRKGTFGWILLFQLAVPSELPGYLFGLARFRFRRYLAALALAEIPYAIATVYGSSAFLSRQLVPLIAAGAAAALLGLAAIQALKRLGR